MEGSITMVSSSRKEEDGDRKDKSNWLCEDVLTLIISRLFLDDVKNFQCVCESWRHIHPPQMLSPEDFPISGRTQWLMCIKGGGAKLYHPLYKEPYVMKNVIPARSTVRFSNNGWLLMTSRPYRSDYTSLFFLNPSTSDIIRLPNIARDLNSVFFTRSPGSIDCMVIGMYWVYGGICICTLLRGAKDWQYLDQVDNYENNKFSFSNVSPVLHGDKFYFLGEDGRLGVLTCCHKKEKHNNNNTMSWKVCQTFNTPSAIKVTESFLLECDGALFSVFLDVPRDWISILKLNDSTMTWEAVNSLGENMFFLGSRTSSFSRKKVIEGMQNRIYFPLIYKNLVVSYSLDKGRFQTLGKSSQEAPSRGKPLFSCWIETSCSDQDQELDWLALN